MGIRRFTRQNVLYATFGVILLFILNVAAVTLVPDVPTWPMVLVTIFLRYHSRDKSETLLLFASGILGITAAFAFSFCFEWAGVIMGESAGYAIVLLVMLSAIFYGQVLCPKVVNAVCFAYLSLFYVSPGSLPQPWGVLALIGMMVGGGGLVLAGFMLARRISEKRCLNE